MKKNFVITIHAEVEFSPEMLAEFPDNEDLADIFGQELDYEIKGYDGCKVVNTELTECSYISDSPEN